MRSKHGETEYICKAAEVLQIALNDKQLESAVPHLINAIQASKTLESLGTDVTSMMLKQRLLTLMKVQDSNSISQLLGLMWKSHWSQQ